MFIIMRVLYVYNINSIVDNLIKQNLMYSLVVSYKVKLHMQRCTYLWYYVEYNESNKHNTPVYSKCSVSFTIVHFIVPRRSWFSNYGIIKRITVKTLMVIIPSKLYYKSIHEYNFDNFLNPFVISSIVSLHNYIAAQWDYPSN